MSRWLSAGIALALFATVAVGQSSNEDKYKKKLEKDFVKKIEWTQTMAKATDAATQSGKLIFGYFTRSYSP